MNLARWVAIIISLIGVACLVIGIIFIIQGNDGKQSLTVELSPLPLDQVDAQYDVVKEKIAPLRAAEEPNIQAGTALPSPTYSYLSAQRTSLGLARTNIGLTQFITTSGIVDLVLGVGLLLTGMVLFIKAKI